MTTTATWSDQQGNRDRKAWALLVGPGDAVTTFSGESIPGVVAVAGHDYNKNGKWSSTTFRLTLADGVRLIAGHNGWETGRFIEGLAAASGRLGSGRVDRWIDVANALGISVPSAMAFLRAWRPKAAEELDQVDRDLEAVDEAAGPEGAEEISISFGSPTRRAQGGGFWTWPVRVFAGPEYGAGGQRSEPPPAEIARVVPGPVGDEFPSWATPVVCDPRGVPAAVRVLSSTHTAGMHGGYVSLRLAVPAGATARHGAV